VLVEFYIGNCRVVRDWRRGGVIGWMSRDLGNEFQFGTQSDYVSASAVMKR